MPSITTESPAARGSATVPGMERAATLATVTVSFVVSVAETVVVLLTSSR